MKTDMIALMIHRNILNIPMSMFFRPVSYTRGSARTEPSERSRSRRPRMIIGRSRNQFVLE